MSTPEDAPHDVPAPEFTRPLSVAELREAGGATLSSEAGEAARAALVTRFGVEAVAALSVEATVAPWGDGGWRVDGRARARLVQTCVVTLEPVETAIDEPFRRFLIPPAGWAEAEAALPERDREDLERLGQTVDPGEIAAEAVALAIDPYPRKAGVAFEGVVHGPPGAEPLTDEAARPFAKLAALRRGEDG